MSQDQAKRMVTPPQLPHPTHPHRLAHFLCWNKLPCFAQPYGEAWASLVALGVTNPLVIARDLRDASSIPESERSPGGRHGNPLQCYCLENPMDRGAWQATVQRVAKSQTQLKRFRMRVYLKGGIINHFYFLVFYFCLSVFLHVNMCYFLDFLIKKIISSIGL